MERSAEDLLKTYLGERGHHVMRGVVTPQEIFTLIDHNE